MEPSPLHLAGAAEAEGSRFHVLVPRLLFMLLETKGSISMHQSYRNLDTKADGEFVSGPDGQKQGPCRQKLACANTC